MTDRPASPPPPPPGDALDPANQSLADALRKSFAVLKGLMLVLVVAYLLSGWFRVQPGEVGFVVRYGRVIGAGANRILQPGWHWAFPYPVDRVVTVATEKERLQGVQFLFQISEEDKLRGIRRVVFNPLSPLRDNYLLSGDMNIFHAQLTVRYRVTDPVAYVGHLYDVSPFDDQPRERELLGAVVSNAAIRVSAQAGIASILGAGQEDFLAAVTRTAQVSLDELRAAGRPTGIEIIAVIAPEMSGLQAIMPPRQVQEEFDRVVNAEQQRDKAIQEARGKAEETLRLTAGPAYAELVEAIDAEFSALVSYLESTKATAGRQEDVASAEAELRRQSAATDELLLSATGEVQQIVNDARAARDRAINEAIADAQQVRELEPQYRRYGDFLLTRLRTDFVRSVLTDPNIIKVSVPVSAKEYWLQIPRESEAAAEDAATKKPKPSRRDRSEGFIDRQPLKAGPQRVP